MYLYVSYMVFGTFPKHDKLKQKEYCLKYMYGQEKNTLLLFPNSSMFFQSHKRHLCCLLILFYPHNEIQE